MTNIDQLIGKVAEHNGIRLEKGDPAFALVTLNELVLRDAVGEIQAELRSTVEEITESVRRLDARSGAIMAREVTQSAASIRRELQQDINSASLQARELVRRVDSAHRQPAVILWVSIGVLSGLLLFFCGVLVGRWTVANI
jgi:hypothetical protein